MNTSRLDPSAARWLPAAAAVALVGTVVVAGVALGSGSEAGPTTPAQGASFDGDAAAVAPQSTTAPIVESTTTAPAKKTKLDRTLVEGVVGNDVKRVQRRLTELGFRPGPDDGIYGQQTIQAVWGFEKLVMDAESNAPTGQVTPQMWKRMQDPIDIQPRRPNATPNHTEVYLPEQMVIVFHDDEPAIISHMSSGTNEEWCEEVTISPGEYGNRDGEEPLVRGECGVSVTPGGVFEYYRQVEGIRESALGSMWNPVYFNYGIAIHGALNVPLQPASHGCIRIPMSIDEEFQDLISMGDQVFVFDGVKEPEEYGEQPPIFNWLDPDWEPTTTTSTTTTTTTTTTVAPTTAAPATPAPTPAPTAAPTTAAPTTRAPATTVAAAATTAAGRSGGGGGGGGGGNASSGGGDGSDG